MSYLELGCRFNQQLEALLYIGKASVYLILSHGCLRVVFVDAGVALIDIETKRMKGEQKLKEAQARAVAEHGELALISVDGPKADTNESVSLRPPMLQVYVVLLLNVSLAPK